MLNIGPGQLVMILVIALIVLGPDKLPQAMRTFGRVMTEMRRISSGFQSELRHAFEEDDTLEDRRRRLEREARARASTSTNGNSAASVPASEASEALRSEADPGANDDTPMDAPSPPPDDDKRPAH